MGKKANAKPMRVWLMFNRVSTLACTSRSQKAADQRLEWWTGNGTVGPYRVVEFVAVTPRKRQKGKK